MEQDPGTEPTSDRLSEWVPVDLKGATHFSSQQDQERMSQIRPAIEAIRKQWYDPEQYKGLLENVKRLVAHETHHRELQKLTTHLLGRFRGWKDLALPPGCEEHTTENDYAAIQLYCSDAGYKFIFGLVNQTLRKTELDDSDLLAAVAVIELLNIDLYNYRLKNIGNPYYSNFEGIVHRGISVSEDVLKAFKETAEKPDPLDRNFSIPLAIFSASTDITKIQAFLRAQPKKDYFSFHWVIHIFSADPTLLSVYQKKYPDSIVTSLCAMPIASISEFSEKEVMLRGAFLQIISMTQEYEDGKLVYKLEMVMLNTNRDHGSELTEHRDEKAEQRLLINQVVQASKYRACAKVATLKGLNDDAAKYQARSEEITERILAGSRETLQPVGVQAAHTNVITWTGASTIEGFPNEYAARRGRLADAAFSAKWEKVRALIEDDFDWHMQEWCNAPRLYATREDALKGSGYTVLHQAAYNGANAQFIQWLLELGAWKTLRTTDSRQETAYEIALRRKREMVSVAGNRFSLQTWDTVIDLLRPTITCEMSLEHLARLESGLHLLLKDIAGEKLDKHAFRMPQLSVLLEAENSRMWIPIPELLGGISVELDTTGSLSVTSLFKEKDAKNWSRTISAD